MFKLVGIEFTYEQLAEIATNILKRKNKLSGTALRKNEGLFFNVMWHLDEAIPDWLPNCQWWMTADPPGSEDPNDERIFFICSRYKRPNETPEKFEKVPILERHALALAWLSDASGIEPEDMMKMWTTVPQLDDWAK